MKLQPFQLSFPVESQPQIVFFLDLPPLLFP